MFAETKSLTPLVCLIIEDLIMSNLNKVFANKNFPVNVTFVNPYSISVGELDQFREFDHVFIDSSLLLTVTNFFRIFHFLKPLKKCSFDFSSLASSVFEKVEREGYTILFVGGTKSEIEQFRQVITHRFTDLNATFIDGYDVEQIDKVASTKFDVAIYGLGCPLQERLLMRYSRNKKYSFTCGGFITQTAKSSGNFYPNLVVLLNIRWLYRFIHERHVLRRTIKHYPRGIIKFIRQGWYDLFN